MSRSGYYEMKLSPLAVSGVVPSDHLEWIGKGEWAWVSTVDHGWILIHRCPDCDCMGTLWQNGTGHNIDASGNVTPSVKMTCMHPECDFHTMPTKLLGFVDIRSS